MNTTPEIITRLREELAKMDVAIDSIDAIGATLEANATGNDAAARNTNRTEIKSSIAVFVTAQRADVAAARAYIDERF